MTPPDVLAGRYALRRRIGSGGMGEVWLAEDRTLGRDVAVKLLDLGSGDDPVATQRFRTEARTAAALSHPNVVAVFDAGTEGGPESSTAFLVMELLPGPTLAQLVRTEGPLAPERAASYARQAAEGLDAIHRVGVVHRDVKPGNLMLDGHGRVKVVDFGIARLAEATAPMLTATGDVVGSAAYLSPERARGEAATAASDHYALGCTLMTLLTGEPPFTAEHPLAVLRQHLDDPPPRAQDRRPDVPAWLDEVVDGLLAKDPVRRAAGFAALLPDGSASDGAASTTAVLDATAVLPAPVPSTTAPLPAPEPRPRRRTALLATAAVVAVLGLVLLAVALGRGEGDSPTTDGTSPSAPSSSTDAPETPAPQRTDPAPPVDEADTSADIDAAVAALGATIRDADGVEKKAAEDLQKKLEDLQKWQVEDKPVDELVKILDDLEKKLGQHESKGDVSPSAAQSIRAAIDDVRAAV
ncbi:MAG TPA: serine/threonine-protein kinase [Nocardioides sp.]|nr:serine/threonine-protein kinase [Nocardioides sp.]